MLITQNSRFPGQVLYKMSKFDIYLLTSASWIRRVRRA